MKTWEFNEYCEVKVSTIDEIYDIDNQYNKFWELPRPGIHGTTLRAFYRGQSNAEWKIEPSIIRCDVDEWKQYNQIKDKLKGKELFDQISYLQHYFTGTRLIDFTMNLDVAIYFACCDNSETDGAVFFNLYSTHKAEWIDTVIFSELIQMDKTGNMKLRDFSKFLFEKYEIIRNRYETIEQLSSFLISYLDCGYMVTPNDDVNNQRIIRQEGLFYICGLQFTKPIEGYMRWESRAGMNEFICHSVCVPKSLNSGRSVCKVIIDKKNKADIIKRLEVKGITKEYLFPKYDEKNLDDFFS